jgi:hypothetical protein
MAGAIKSKNCAAVPNLPRLFTACGTMSWGSSFLDELYQFRLQCQEIEETAMPFP